MKTRASRFMALIAALAVFSGSLMIGGTLALAQDGVQTSITVENTACVDPTPSSINFRTPNISLPNFNGSNPVHGYLAGPVVYADIYVNNCLEGGWQVTGTMTQFTSGSNTFPASHFRVKGETFSAGNVYSVPPPGEWAAVAPGTVGLGWEDWRAFSVVSGDRWTIDRPFSTGTAASRGEMYQAFNTSTWQIPANTPAGTYSATLTLTWAPTTQQP